MIDPSEKRVLTDLMAVMKPLNLPIMIVGAGARLLVFDPIYGEGRSTKDWDVAVSIDSWATYQELRDRLTEAQNQKCTQWIARAANCQYAR
jgi:predicted nucleotidyltransferase